MAGQGKEQEFGFLDRLHRPAEFSAVMASRARTIGGCFELRYRRRPLTAAGQPVDRARLGLIIPKRFAKRAVLRNLLKRLAREAFRHTRLPPVDIVLRLAKAPAADAGLGNSALRREWRETLNNLLAGVRQ
ncbi:MAG: ribonuclease P protein component [Zoogloeaceae bacterium]|jgi:ribonuclease P protein component|nr:ribonuclease P protein component [Zoogloeaceae bacterium]